MSFGHNVGVGRKETAPIGYVSERAEIRAKSSRFPSAWNGNIWEWVVYSSVWSTHLAQPRQQVSVHCNARKVRENG